MTLSSKRRSSRPPDAFPSSNQRRLAMIALFATICVAPQLFGGAFPWAAVAIAVLCIVCGALALWAHRTRASRVVDWVLAAMGLAWIWTWLQIVPLPMSLGRAIGLGNVEHLESLRGLTPSPIALTLSFDPGSTQLQIIVGAAILSAFIAGRFVGRESFRSVARAVAVSAALLAIVGFAHLALGFDTLFGLYRPRFTAPRLLTPLMNNNHLAGFIVMGTLVAIGLAADRRERQLRPLWVGVCALCVVVIPWTLSRGAIAAFVFGGSVLTWALIRGRSEKERKHVLLSATLLATVLGVGVFAGLRPLLKRFEPYLFDKVEMAWRGLSLLEGSTWIHGVGRGAFSAAFAAKEGTLDRITHPENLFVQWSTEWGVPVTVLLLGTLALAFRSSFWRIRHAATLGASIGVFALFLQNMVDFSLEMPGVVVVAAALLGALLQPRTNEWKSGSTVNKGLFAVLAVFVLGLIVWAPSVIGAGTQTCVDRLTEAMPVSTHETFQEALDECISLHPTEPSLALLAGAHAVEAGDPKAGRWLSAAMLAAPGWADPHVVAARWLLSAGHTDQALLEIREAEERKAGSAMGELCRILQEQPRVEHIERAAPREADLVVDYLNRAESCGELPKELRYEVDSLILKRDPTFSTAAARRAERLIMEGKTAQGIALLEDALTAHLDDASLWYAVARTQLNAGDPSAALAVLDRASARGIESVALMRMRARVQATRGDTEQVQAELTRLRGRAQGKARPLAEARILEGDLEALMGRLDRALIAYRTADTIDPDSGALHRAAGLAERSGRTIQAYQAYRQLCLRNSQSPACKREKELSAKLGSVDGDNAVP